MCNCGCLSCFQGEKSDLESTKILTVRYVMMMMMEVAVVTMMMRRVIMMVVVVVMVTMMRRTVAVMMRMNLVPRDSDGRVIHDAASVEVDHHHHCHHYHHHQHHHHTFCATKICKNNVIAITAKG